MSPWNARRRRNFSGAAFILLIRAAAHGQSQPAASGDSVVTLNPFEVNSDQDKSYGAPDSNTITRFNAELDKLPISADVFTDAFIKDTASQSVEQMIQTYSAGAGLATSDPGGSAATSQALDRNPTSGLALRGLGNTVQERDGFFPTLVNTGTGFTSTFDLDRAEVINGPQALLYGAGGAGGVVNVVSKQAHFSSSATGTTQFQVDQFGDRMAQTDYGVGTDKVAFRTAILEQTVGGRRVNIGGDVYGYYAQVAIRPFKNTVLRISGEQTTYDRINSTNLALTAASTSNDARNGDYLHYLLATNQIQAAAHGAPSGAGPIVNGNLNWNNVDSFGGWWTSELTVNEWAELIAETEWTPWLSTQASFAYDNHVQDLVNSTLTFAAPNVAANPTGQWAAGLTSALPASDVAQPGRSKTMRLSALITNELFAGRMKSQTVLGLDDSAGTAGQDAYGYFQADSGFNVIVSPGVTAAQGRTPVKTIYWPIGGGPLGYPYWAPRSTRVTLNGTNYVRQVANQPSRALISANDPLGVTLGGAIYQHIQLEGSGIYGLNYLQWDDRKIDTLVGFRLARSFEQTLNQGAAAPLPANSTQTSRAHTLSFDVGGDYAVLPWLRPYVAVSDSFLPPTTQLQDPYGRQPQTAHALGEEAGVKATSSENSFSGSIALYHTDSQNEQYVISSSLENDINPTGLNGRFGTPSNWINVRRQAEGLQAIGTAAPTAAWRLRLSAAVTNGKIGTTTTYGQLYNDEFHENAAGQVTYADGSVVYVPPTFNSKTLTEASTVSGAIPLTVTALSTPGNAYYASPQAITGQILSTANVVKVLQVVDATHGAILTGRTGLPISSLQINPALTPNLTIPGQIITSHAGDVTTGYPELSATFTGVYTVPTGFLKGVELGGSVLGGWFSRGYYFYSNGVTPTAQRSLHDNPNTFQVDGIFGYHRKIGRFSFRTQLNVSNLFNHYHVVLLPNSVTGWSTPVGVNATFIQQPRTYLWTNTLQY